MPNRRPIAYTKLLDLNEFVSTLPTKVSVILHLFTFCKRPRTEGTFNKVGNDVIQTVMLETVMEDTTIGPFLFAKEICQKDSNLYMTRPRINSLFLNILVD